MEGDEEGTQSYEHTEHTCSSRLRAGSSSNGSSQCVATVDVYGIPDTSLCKDDRRHGTVATLRYLGDHGSGIGKGVVEGRMEREWTTVKCSTVASTTVTGLICKQGKGCSGVLR